MVGEPKYEENIIEGNSGIVKRSIGFTVARKGYKKKGIISVNPYTGDIMGIQYCLTGYTGKETQEKVKIVPANLYEDKRPSPSI